jgi:hypothetical protein
MVSPSRLVNANEIRICVTNTNAIDYSLMCHLGITFDTLNSSQANDIEIYQERVEESIL